MRTIAAVLALALASALWLPPPLHAQDLYPEEVGVPLDSAVSLARTAATAAFPDLERYLLYSVTPRSLKGDPRGGSFWQVLWQERDFPHRRRLAVRVYQRDGYAQAERLE